MHGSVNKMFSKIIFIDFYSLKMFSSPMNSLFYFDVFVMFFAFPIRFGEKAVQEQL